MSKELIEQLAKLDLDELQWQVIQEFDRRILLPALSDEGLEMNDTQIGIEFAFSEIKKHLAKAYAQTQGKSEWISVEDRLPEAYIPNDSTKFKGVLAYVVDENSGWGGYPMLLWYGEFPKFDEDGYEIEGDINFGWHYERDSEGEFDTLIFDMNGKVSHWMPVLPDPINNTESKGI